MRIDPIGKVLEALDEIIAWALANDSRAGYFASLYRRVTATVKSKIGTGYFDDDARMERLDSVFANRYLTAFAQWRGGDPAISQCWGVAFDAVADRDLIILQHLLAAMNAHIGFDLGIAAAEVAEDRAGLDGLHDDFNKINDVLECLIPTVFAEIGELSPMIHLLEEIDERGEEDLVGIVMSVARDLAWISANELVLLRDAPRLRDDLLAFKDREASWIGRKVLDPGKPLDDVVHAVWLPESKDVRRNVEVLNQPSELPASCTGG
ncbi:MAG: hypothetical protein D6696_01920 [Acidobacteria bacterium]|nr:MAG: hypothetical protein D6696_01920 [Acidobacteriota bacterium]